MKRRCMFIGINSNKQETIAEILAYNKKHSFKFPILKDLENEIADYFGARRTPEVFLLDAERVLRYAGAIDDSSKRTNETLSPRCFGFGDRRKRDSKSV